jgi:hypothetical protein
MLQKNHLGQSILMNLLLVFACLSFVVLVAQF